ncbi:response regulator transcription factor [Prosthecobacter sp.]|uniref:response regulator n=1 Tax=Prosthecobacter sp. TaxID=1965333 RepID=UPI002488E139|nr:response regulator transcription factor [Prosthecobacter sp.]MDI1312087.1 response regulator transcription factor [Prosthecobacter sp.]
MSSITVLLAEDHQIVREGLRAMLNLETDMEVIGEAKNGRQAVELVSMMKPDVIVMDIAMPLLNGMEATRQILHAFPGSKVLILSAHSDDAYVAMVMGIGASGYLIKQTAAHVLPEAIRAVHQGKTYFSPIIAKRRDHQRQKARDQGELPGKAAPTLSAREMEVLQLIAEGKANKESAEELGISVKTVEKHRQSLMDKLNIHDTAGLTRYAIAMGIIENSVQVTII